ncbi:MAG: R3H domain-containing nucleic acid-binding protein [Cyanobacteriota bacterium]|nr:R3H domain-containing nucleic acid-binding protein [Cyanobacteriota bacterium]
MTNQALTSGVEWLTALLALQGLDTTVSATMVNDDSGDSCWLTIADQALSADQVQTLIGPAGAVLDAIQYLANTTLNLGKSEGEQQAFTIELAGYRARRLAELKLMAEAAADQVRASGQEYELKGLSAAERRQVHHFLSAQSGLATFSRGKEPDRRLVVCLDSSP